MIAVRMCDKNLSDLAEVIARLHDAPCHAIASVNQVERVVDDQQIG